jgi:hypothetical protein
MGRLPGFFFRSTQREEKRTRIGDPGEGQPEGVELEETSDEEDLGIIFEWADGLRNAWSCSRGTRLSRRTYSGNIILSASGVGPAIYSFLRVVVSSSNKGISCQRSRQKPENIQDSKLFPLVVFGQLNNGRNTVLVGCITQLAGIIV